MKRYTYKIANWNHDDILSPIRSKKDSIRLLMKSVKLMIANNEVSDNAVAGTMVLVVSKMSRLFYFIEGKFFSIAFPFLVSDSGGELTYYTKHMIDIDSRVTSAVLSIIGSSETFDSICISEFADPIVGLAIYDCGFWPFLRELLMHEDGYLRYDYDKKRENGRIHPLHHLDIFYSSGGSFKLGLNRGFEEEALIDMFNTETDCHYLDSL
jgi:hypothetical protein